MKSFVIHKDWCSTVSHLIKSNVISKNEAGELLNAIFTYQLTGEIEEGLPNVVFAVLSLLIDQFKRDEEKYNKKVERNRENGKKGGRPIEEITTQDKRKNPVGYCGLKDEKPAKKEKHVKPQTQFEEFYKLYPKKVGKQTALKAYEKALKLTTHESIIEGVEKYKKQIQVNKTEPQFIAMPATWLNGGRWDDDYKTVVITAQKPADYYDTSKNKYFIDNGDYTDYSKENKNV